METAFFVYTVVLLLAFTAAGILALSAYFVSRKRAYLFVMGYFAFYVIDLALIFQYEYLGTVVPSTAAEFYTIADAPLKIILSLGVLECLWLFVCDFLDERRKALHAVPAVAYAIVEVALIAFAPEGPWRQWAFYTARQAFLAWMLGYVAFRCLSSPNSVAVLRVKRNLPAILVAAALVVLIIGEDSFNIFIFSPDFSQPLPLLYLSERNFSENILALLIAVYTFHSASDTLRLRFQEPPATDAPQVQTHVDDLLPQYALRYGLTAREREVARLVLLGKDNQNIANELQLALGTVKAHVHNILKKTGQPTRRDLAQDFWKK